MCEVKANSKPSNTGSGVDIGVVCEISGKPITVTNKYGMFCVDMCDFDEAKEAHDLLTNAINNCNEDPMQLLENLMNALRRKKHERF